MRVIVLSLLYVGCLQGCNNSSPDPIAPMQDSIIRPKTVEELKQELKEQEQNNLTSYLSVHGSLKENITQRPDLFHHTKTDGYILTASIENTASIAKFKDAIVIVTYFSETNSEIESKEIVIYKFLNPNSTIEFEEKVYPPNGFAKFQLHIKTASSAN